MSNKQWWEAQWKNIYDLPATARIAVKYTNLEAQYKQWMEQREYKREGNEKAFYASFCKPSQERHTKYLRNGNKEKLVQLHTAPYDTLIPGVGYKTKHYKTKEDLYVIQFEFAPAITRSEDRPQEYVQIVKKLEFGWNTPPSYENKFFDTVLARQASVQKRYVDRLTKKHREALTLLKIMDVDGYVEGVGYRKAYNRYMGWDEVERRSVYESVVLYFIDAVKREEDEQ